jgi:hypothetical protein
MMVATWLLVALSALACVRALIALRRSSSRRESIERLVTRLAPGSRLTDQDADGSVLDIVVGHTLGSSEPGGEEPG